MDPLAANDIRRCFVNLSKSKAKALSVPADPAWDDLDFLGWRDRKAPNRGYLVVPRETGGPIGIALSTAATGAPRRGSALCDLCHSAHLVTEVALFVAARAGAAGRDGNTVGTYICADLACSLYVRGLKELELPQGETAGPEERARRLRARLDAFVNRCLATV